MKSSLTPMQHVNMMAKLADLTETGCQNTLVLDALIELLAQKGILTKEELVAKVRQLDTEQHQQMVGL